MVVQPLRSQQYAIPHDGNFVDILSSPRDDFEIQNFSSRQQLLIEKKLFTPTSLSYTLLTSILGAGRGGANESVSKCRKRWGR